MAELNELISLGKQPVAADKPAGTSVQFDPDYESLRAEVQKLDSVTQEPVNWTMVVDTASIILKDRSKHLLVATYLALGLFEKQGYAGLAAGLTICRDLIANFWDNMEPPPARKRGRIEAFHWLAERAGKAAADVKPGGDDKDSVTACVTLMSEIQSALQARLGDEAPGFGELERIVKQHISDAESAARAAEARKAQAAKVAAGELDERSTAEDARKVLTKVRQTAKLICDIMRKADPADPVPYGLIRAITWASQKDIPPHSKGTTQIPAPAADAVARISDLSAKGDWPALIEAAEAAFANFPFWIDLHRWTAQALGAMGNAHTRAQAAVKAEVAVLVSRLPEILELNFANGTSFASTETLKWIEAEVRPALGSGGGQAAGGGDGAPEGLSEAAREARKLAGRGQLPEAIRLMQEKTTATGLRRDQFLWRLELGRLCLDAGQPALAIPLLEELEGQIQDYRLEAWEPRLALTVYTMLLSARRTVMKTPGKVTPELTLKTNQLHDKVCRLDPAAALSLEAK